MAQKTILHKMLETNPLLSTHLRTALLSTSSFVIVKYLKR